MTLKIRDGGATHPAAPISIQIGGTLRPVRTGRIQIAGVLQTFYLYAGPLAVTVSNASGRADPGGTVTTHPAVATPSGGASPYAYSWVQTSHTGNAVTINTPAMASTTFTQADAGNTSDTCDGTVTVTDSFGATASAPFETTFNYILLGGHL